MYDKIHYKLKKKEKKKEKKNTSKNYNEILKKKKKILIANFCQVLTVLVTVLSTLCVLILNNLKRDRHWYYSHFTDGEVESQRS